jgi:hypothetical protein
MWRLAVATLCFGRTGQVAAFVAMAFGTAIVLACGALMKGHPHRRASLAAGRGRRSSSATRPAPRSPWRVRLARSHEKKRRS